MIASLWLRGMLALILMLPVVRPGRADEVWGFVQLTCAPELGYFSIRRFHVMNLPKKGPYLTQGLAPGPEAIAAIGAKYGIFDSTALQAHPLDCTVPRVAPVAGWETGRPGFRVRAIGHLDVNSSESSYRDIVDNVEVILQDKPLGALGLNPYGLSLGIDSIEVFQDGVALTARTCLFSMPAGLIDGDDHTCREQTFQADAR